MCDDQNIIKQVKQINVKLDGQFECILLNGFKINPHCCYKDTHCNINCVKSNIYFKQHCNYSDEYNIENDNTKDILTIETCGKTFETDKYDIEIDKNTI